MVRGRHVSGGIPVRTQRDRCAHVLDWRTGRGVLVYGSLILGDTTKRPEVSRSVDFYIYTSKEKVAVMSSRSAMYSMTEPQPLCSRMGAYP
jgi:hypothetical protein